MLSLDHVTVIAPTLAEGVAHVSDCLGLDVPFGTRHAYMGTHNHRVQLGGRTYLEIVAVDPEGAPPGRPRWFGLDDQDQVRADWAAGRRLRGWVARTPDLEASIRAHRQIFGEAVSLPPAAPEFGFSIPADGGLPLQGALPSLIDHRGAPTDMAEIRDLGARLRGFSVTYPDPRTLGALYTSLKIAEPPQIHPGPGPRYRAEIETPCGLRVLT